MAKIRFKCACGKVLTVEGKFAGRIAKCPGCSAPVRVPSPKGGKGGTEANMAKELSSLSSAYGEAVKARARNKRMKEALSVIGEHRRKRYLIIGACVLGVALLALLVVRLMTSYGPDWRAKDYSEAAQPLLPPINDSDPLVRAASRWELAGIGDKEVNGLLADLGNDSEPVVRLVSLWALARADDADLAESLGPLLSDDDLDVRMTAAFTIARLESGSHDIKALAPHATQALADESEWLMLLENVVETEKKTADITELLDRRLSNGTAKVRRIIAWLSVAMLAPEFAAPRVRTMLHDTDPDVVISAIHALHVLITAEAFDRIPKTPEVLCRDQRALRLQALNGIALKLLQQQPGTRATTYIETDARIKTAAVLALARNGQIETAALFDRALKDPDWFVRFAALKGLEMLPADTALGVIRSATDYKPESDTEWARRVMARITAAAGPPKTKEPEPDNE
jgi:HEAT repeat protein